MVGRHQCGDCSPRPIGANTDLWVWQATDTFSCLAPALLRALALVSAVVRSLSREE